MTILENEQLAVTIADKGAELQSIYHKTYELEYLWQADEAYWSKHSPVLFPIVGELKEQTYNYDGNSYRLLRHGFARDMIFDAEKLSETEAVYRLRWTEETYKHYPFRFCFSVRYTLADNSLQVSYEVDNEDEKDMYFSIGAHPALNVPLVDKTEYSDYYLQFSEKEVSDRWMLDGGLIAQPKDFLNDENRIQLNKELFYEDALVFKHLKSDSVSIASDKTDRSITMNFDGFPYFGIWAAKDAPFVCLEPWHGIADSVEHNQNLKEKEGIITLMPKRNWQNSWSITCD